MFCQNCGKEIPDGSAFCTFCGTQTKAATSQNATNGGIDINKQAVQSLAASSWQLFTLALKKPVSAVEAAVESKTKEGLILGVVHILILLITNWIHLPIAELSSYVDVSDRFKISLTFSVVAAAVVALTALITFLLSGKDRTKYTYLKTLSSYCTLTVYGTIGLLLLFVMGFAGIGLSVAVIVITVAVWCILSIMATFHFVEGDDDKRTVLSLVISMIAFVITALIAVIFIRTVIGNAVSSIVDSYRYLF